MDRSFSCIWLAKTGFISLSAGSGPTICFAWVFEIPKHYPGLVKIQMKIACSKMWLNRILSRSSRRFLECTKGHISDSWAIQASTILIMEIRWNLWNVTGRTNAAFGLRLASQMQHLSYNNSALSWLTQAIHIAVNKDHSWLLFHFAKRSTVPPLSKSIT